jgi:hypothetical protein
MAPMNKPDLIVLAAAKCGGITHKVDSIKAYQSSLRQQTQRKIRKPILARSAATEPIIPGIPMTGRTAERISPIIPTAINAMIIPFIHSPR